MPLGGMSFAAEKLLLEKILQAVGNPPVQILLWNGLEIPTQKESTVAQVLIRDLAALLKLFFNHRLYFGELYSARRVEIQGDLLDFLEAVFRCRPLRRANRSSDKLLLPFDEIRRNTLAGARRNIRHHYDIGNDFYKLWLDERMVYTCAYFQHPDASLEEAQLAKMDHICRKLNLRPGETVVEAGCGWGALALHMAKHYGVTVRAYNISREQISLARERARAEGLDGKVEFIEDDYRHMRGKFDAFVSVGMLEHVGLDHYRELGEVINRVLKDDGRGLIHSIGFNFPRPMDDWAERHIFPGASPPSLAQMMQILEPYDFSVLDVENLRLHYARTLEHWLQRYEDNVDRVSRMFDENFVLAWRLYLAASITTFKIGKMQLFQLTFSRASNNRIPWTRQYLYGAECLPAGLNNGNL
ncbi:MAG: cyclopropane-fatty-acyl-phospholipid synthase family protein [Gammaproteobacteria bacterium]|nr:cyclopropane-fatty-acyl-phospholipid synthase family protein [Gammaproteobacteria bacterium]MBU1480940.1 cyclopropane-fatty-acyl-phospholipid synthase family protein [Gammaproteobacteria bacterium]